MTGTLETLKALLVAAKKIHEEDKYRAASRSSDFYHGAAHAGDCYIQQIEFAIKRANTIERVAISPMPKKHGDPMPEVIATMGDGREERLFSYYPDEISFGTNEFIGLTLDQALQNKPFSR